MLDFTLRKTVEKLGQDLVDVFASPEYIPGCEVKDITNIDEYDTNNGWIDALCGRHNQQQVRYNGYPVGVTVGDFIDIQYFPNYKLFVCFGSGGTVYSDPSGTANAGAVTKLDTYTVPAGGTSTVTFSGIDQTYTDLLLIVNGKATGTAISNDNVEVILNNNTSAIYDFQRRDYQSTTPSGAVGTAQLSWATPIMLPSSVGSTPAGERGGGHMVLFNYSGSAYKYCMSETFVMTGGTSSNFLRRHYSGRFASTAAITEIDLDSAWAEDSIIDLYGIK